MPRNFDKFVHEENIRRFRDSIARETDPIRLSVLKVLLKDELAKERPTPSLDDPPDPVAPNPPKPGERGRY